MCTKLTCLSNESENLWIATPKYVLMQGLWLRGQLCEDEGRVVRWSALICSVPFHWHGVWFWFGFGFGFACIAHCSQHIQCFARSIAHYCCVFIDMTCEIPWIPPTSKTWKPGNPRKFSSGFVSVIHPHKEGRTVRKTRCPPVTFRAIFVTVFFIQFILLLLIGL